MPLDVFRPKCRLCRCPVVDGGVSLSEVDKDKLTNWWLTRRGVPIDEESIETSWVCLNCVREANYNHECSSKEEVDCVWWPEMDAHYKYFLEGWMKSCSVPLKKLSKEEIQQHGEQQNCSSQQPVVHQDFICSFEQCRAAFSRESDLKKHSNKFHMGMNIFVSVNNLYGECQFCLKTYYITKNPMLHFTTSPCLNCKEVFSCRGQLDQHRKCCFLKCKTCKFKSKSRRKVSVHEKKCLAGRVMLTCHFCALKFLTKAMLLNHIVAYHLKKRKTLFQCRFCGKNFVQQFNLKIHLQNFHSLDLGLLKCNLCALYVKSQNLAAHKEQKHNQQQYTSHVECDMCGKKVVEVLLSRHKLTRCKNKDGNQKQLLMYNCPACEFSSCKRHGAKRHILKYHLRPPSNLTCTKCSQKFNGENHWHMHFCPSREKQMCPKCGLTMYSEFLLQHSIKEQCELCNTYFACDGLYLKHKSENTSCYHCKNKFCNGELLEKHMSEKHDFKESWIQLQFEELGHKCYRCRMYFEDNETLSQHTLNEHPLSFCDLCGTLCKDKTDLENHLSTSHYFSKKGGVASGSLGPAVADNSFPFNRVKTLRFKCTVCNKSPMRKHELELHLQKSHPDFTLPTTSTVTHEMSVANSLSQEKKTLPMSNKNFRREINATFVKNCFCPICNLKLVRRENVIKHIRKYHDGKKINSTCPNCKKKFVDTSVRRSHFCETRPKLSCKFCNLTMYSEYLTSHQIISVCARCNKKLSCENLLRKHLDEEHTCQHCKLKFCELNSLIGHLEQKHNSKLDVTCWKGRKFASLGFPCFKCKMFFPDLPRHSCHMLEKHSPKMTCNLCGCLVVQSMKAHCMKTHRAPQDYKCTPPFSCQICERKFYTKIKLISHINRDHVVNKKLWNSDGKFLNLFDQNCSEANSEATDKQVYKVLFQDNYVRYELISTSDLIVAETRKFICDVCGMDFETAEIAEKHLMSEHHDEFNRPCLECNAYFILQLELDAHLKSKHIAAVTKDNDDLPTTKPIEIDQRDPNQDENIFYCWCKKRFSQHPQLLNHFNTWHMKGGVKCNYCPTICTSIQQLKMHFVVSHEVKYKVMYKKIQFQNVEFACKSCDQRFADVELFEAHTYSVHSKPKPMCDICGKEFSSTIRLKCHLRVTHGTPITMKSHKSHYLCTICNQKYYNLESAELHMELFHMSTNHYCNNCFLSFKSYRKVLTHTQKQSCEKKFKCEICGNTFVNLTLLDLHKNNQIKCSFCRAKFCHKKAVSLHIKKHHSFHSNLILLEHNYSMNSKHSLGQSSQDLNHTMLIKAEPMESETGILEKDPLEIIQPDFGVNCIKIKEEVFD